MSQAARNPAQIDLMIKSFGLRKNSIKNQIMQINASIVKKKSSIEMFRNYAAANAHQPGSLSSQSVQIMKNNEAFYQKLAHVLDSETTDLVRLESIKTKLIASYHELTSKLDGLESIRRDIGLEQEAVLDKLEESDLSDLSITVLSREREWNR